MNFKDFDAIIDARTPSEYALDHIPGAVSAPVLDDAQRAEVGTLYKQVSPFEAKKLGGALIAQNVARHVERLFGRNDKTWRPFQQAGRVWDAALTDERIAHLSTDEIKARIAELNQAIDQKKQQLEQKDEEYRKYAAAVKDAVIEAVNRRYEQKESSIGPEMMRLHEKYILLQVIDQLWKDHLLNVDHLKEGIGLRGYGQRDPLIEYKKESYEIFQEMMELIQDRVVKYLWKTEVVVEREGDRQEDVQRVQRAMPPQKPKAPPMVFSGSGGSSGPAQVQRKEPKIGRNDPCWCGSGKKFKRCHGA